MEIPKWLSSMLNAEFYTTHFKDENLEKAYFCINCGGNSLSKTEVDAKHKDHRVFRAKKVSHHYAYTEDDILSLGSNVLDVTDVCVYCINATSVYFPRSRVLDDEKKNKKKDYYSMMKGKPGYCFTCGMVVKKPSLFCSILCKLECVEDRARLDSMKVIMEQEGLMGLSLGKDKKRKRDNNSSSASRVCLKIKHGGKTVILSNKKKRVLQQEEKMEDLLMNVVKGKINDNGKKMSHRKISRKGIPRRSPFF